MILKSCVGGDIMRVYISVGRIKSAEDDELWVESQSIRNGVRGGWRDERTKEPRCYM